MSHRKFERKPRAHDMCCLTPIMGRVMMLSHTARLDTLQQRPLPESAQSSNIGDLAYLTELNQHMAARCSTMCAPCLSQQCRS